MYLTEFLTSNIFSNLTYLELLRNYFFLISKLVHYLVNLFRGYYLFLETDCLISVKNIQIIQSCYKIIFHEVIYWLETYFQICTVIF